MIREAFRAVLLGDAALNAAVASSDGSRRIYPLMMPQGVRDPSLVYQRPGGIFETTLDGPVALTTTTIQLDAWALDPDLAANLIALAAARLNGFAGVVTWGDDSPPAQCSIKGIFMERQRDGYDKDAKLYRDARDFRVLWCP